MPTFKEKCPEFGQKIRIKDSNHKFFIFIEERNGDYHLASDHCGVNGFGPSWEWEPITEETQWTQITEDESTWPSFGHFFIMYDNKDPFECLCDGVGDTFATSKNNLRFQFINCIGMQWCDLPRPHDIKKEEKPYISDESIEQLKRAETEARLWKLERKADEFDDFIRSQKRKEKSPWKSSKEKPIHQDEVLGRSKLSTGDFIYGIGCIFRGDWSWSNCSRPEEWMEIPK